MRSKRWLLLGALASASVVVSTSGAQAARTDADGLSASGTLVPESTDSRSSVVVNGQKLIPVVVRLTADSVASYDGGVAGLPATSPAVTGQPLNANSQNVRRYRAFVAGESATVEQRVRAAVPETQVTRRLDLAFAGFAARVPADELKTIEALPGVAGIYHDELLQLNTDVSNDFIGADDLWAAQGGVQNAGGGVIVGVLDSGVWPEHPSFSDPDPNGVAYPAPPVVPGSNGFSAGARSTCDFGNTAYNPNDAAFTCNGKLIGAYNFTDGYQANVGLLPTEFLSGRDDNGHGTHTATTSAGNNGVAASIFGVPRGTVSGVAPRAHVVSYRVCGNEGCFGSDSAAAVGQAILDGVDVINFSISGGANPYGDVVSLAFLSAYDAGVLVSASAGNAGPDLDTTDHREPWTLTVGASTSNRHFLSTVTLTSTDGASLVLKGASVTEGISSPLPVVVPTPANCNSPAAAGTLTGMIAVCPRGVIARVMKGFNVQAGGAAGMLLYNPTQQGLSTDNHFLPAVHLENDAGAQLTSFLAAHPQVSATFTPGAPHAVQGDVMAPFSSRGGPGQTLGVSKPDVTAPGVQILAGATPMPATSEGGRPGELFQAIQGTSMSSPHAAGAAALLKASHPSWTPGQIKSALMMGAAAGVVTVGDGTVHATPFDEGSGSIRPAVAARVGFTISEDAADYVALQDNLWDANYPSLYVPQFAGAILVQRTLHDESGANRNYRVQVSAPSDLKITVPTSVNVPKNGNATIDIAVDGRNIPLGEVRHGSITFVHRQSGQALVFPITVVRAEGDVTAATSCSPTDIRVRQETSCQVTVTNNSFQPADVTITDFLTNNMRIDRPSVVGATVLNSHTLQATATLGAQQAAVVSAAVAPGSTPAGYLPLSLFGTPAIAGVGDETIVNYTVPAFEFAGETWTRIGIVSNGYAVVGGGTGADVDFVNTDFPNVLPPNNVLAPFWTDLNPGAAGALRIDILTDGVNDWLVLEWDGVRNFSNAAQLNSFQIWIGVNGTEDVTYAFGPVTGGDLGYLTVGAENRYGSSGQAVYFDGAGTAPANGTEVLVSSVPGGPGGSHTITFDAIGVTAGTYRNDVLVDTTAVAGDIYATFSGTVRRR